MKRYIYALIMLSALPVGLSATGQRSYSSYGRPQQYSTTYEYDAARDQNSVDHYVTQDDRRIAEEVRHKIQGAHFDNPDDVQIFVEYGKVLLEGKTNSNENRQAAEDLASKVHGVRNVVNGLYVDNRPVKKASQVQKK